MFAEWGHLLHHLSQMTDCNLGEVHEELHKIVCMWTKKKVNNTIYSHNSSLWVKISAAPSHPAASCLQLFLWPSWEFVCLRGSLRWCLRLTHSKKTNITLILWTLTLTLQRCACASAWPTACLLHLTGPVSQSRPSTCTCRRIFYFYIFFKFIVLFNIKCNLQKEFSVQSCW